MSRYSVEKVRYKRYKSRYKSRYSAKTVRYSFFYKEKKKYFFSL